MVVDDVHHDRDAAGVRGGDEAFERGHAAVVRVDREQVTRVVALEEIGRELVRREQLHDVDAELDEVVEARDEAVEGAVPVFRARVARERADVELVDHPRGERRRDVARDARGNGRRRDDRVAVRRRLGEAARVAPPNRAPVVAIGDEVLVLVARRGAGDVCRPVAVALALERRLAPRVELAAHRDRRRERRPDAERHASIEGHSAHPGSIQKAS